MPIARHLGRGKSYPRSDCPESLSANAGFWKSALFALAKPLPPSLRF